MNDLGNLIAEKNIKRKTTEKVLAIIFMIFAIIFGVVLAIYKERILQGSDSQFMNNYAGYILIFGGIATPIHLFKRYKNAKINLYENGITETINGNDKTIYFKDTMLEEYTLRTFSTTVITYKDVFLRVYNDNSFIEIENENNEEFIDLILDTYKNFIEILEKTLDLSTLEMQKFFFGRSFCLIDGEFLISNIPNIKPYSKFKKSKVKSKFNINELTNYTFDKKNLILNYIDKATSKGKKVKIKIDNISNSEILLKILNYKLGLEEK